MSATRQMWEIVREAALCGAAEHVGPSDISTADYERLVGLAVDVLDQLFDQPAAEDAGKPPKEKES